ncbi:NAD(P)-binding domain-containing protein [Nocardioides sp. CER19]|uniref:NAD(P)-binding domain-containing protein n=1 Tax=Nocardioides sp. CER19 TaxID=3038538 RepID=UPI002447AFE1|nr:NAD(P)-binding domain-containing protein [Nocardioides sp. CER19]MDH2413044.1 NAD(P)-binding domain-containing protein [Nocardioides sp. CER19]
MSDLPVVVIGAGPQGLAAAAHLLERGLDPIVLESGRGPGAAVAEWGHVRLFSEWSELVDQAAARLLERTGWTAPTSGYPTGAEWVEQYLAPLGKVLGERVRYDARVTGVSRKGRDRLVDADRGEQPFTIHLTDAAGNESRLEARAVIDASGTWRKPNPAGADGLPALGETANSDLVTYSVPDSQAPGRYAGKHTVLLGAGASALNAIIELDRIAQQHPDTTITWVLRRGSTATTYGGGEADQLPQRGALGLRARAAVEAGRVQVVTGFRTAEIRRASEGDTGRAVVVAEDGRELAPADSLVVLTGFRPDLSFLSELRLDLDPTLEAPRNIAVEIDPNIHSCGSVQATGARDLAHAQEPNLYVVGMKSYGRAPTFLAMTGFEQVRSIAAMLAGDVEAAERIELVLPDTGVCGGSGLYDDPESASGGGCCAPAPALLTIGGPASLSVGGASSCGTSSGGCG